MRVTRSTKKVQNSQAYRKIDTTNVSMNLTFDVNETFLSCHVVFSFISVVVDSANLVMISSSDPSSETFQPRYLKMLIVSSFSVLCFSTFNVFFINSVVTVRLLKKCIITTYYFFAVNEKNEIKLKKYFSILLILVMGFRTLFKILCST